MKKVTIIGLGLMGGSLAAALKKYQAVWVNAVDTNQAALEQAQQAHIIDSYCDDIATAATDSDFVFLAVPLSAMQHCLQALKPVLNDTMIISDLGSVKQSVIDAAITVFDELPARFIPSHPIVGSEKSGVAAANADLFQQRTLILTPNDTQDAHAIDELQQLWQSLGAKVSSMSAKKHDTLLAMTSHLPHVLAFNFLQLLQQQDNADEYLAVTGGGFDDFTRIAHSDPLIWRDICLANRQALSDSISHYQKQLHELQQLIDTQDGAALKTFLAGKQNRS